MAWPRKDHSASTVRSAAERTSRLSLAAESAAYLGVFGVDLVGKVGQWHKFAHRSPFRFRVFFSGAGSTWPASTSTGQRRKPSARHNFAATGNIKERSPLRKRERTD
jgi:hypothetical protein